MQQRVLVRAPLTPAFALVLAAALSAHPAALAMQNRGAVLGGEREPSIPGEAFSPPRRMDHDLHLRYGRFDPARDTLDVPRRLSAPPETRRWIVQLEAPATDAFRRALAEHGADALLYLPAHAWVVDVEPARVAGVRALAFVRSVTPFEPAFKLEPELLAAADHGGPGTIGVELLTMRRGGQAPVEIWIAEQGGTIESVSWETRALRATLRADRLVELARLDDVLWIERLGSPGSDMDIARVFHGSESLAATLGLEGEGVHVELLDLGVDLTHPAIQNWIIHNGNSSSPHGTALAGILVGNGAGNPALRGVMPKATLVVGDITQPWAGGSRYAHTAELVDPGLPYQCVLQTNSWGGSYTTLYSSQSAEMDQMLFDFEHLAITQSMGNAGTTSARPQAWAKNVISVGGITHRNTLTTADDLWQGASVGPAADGRIKPDLASFYDDVDTTSSGGGYATFGGTSVATAITAGHLGLFYELWDLGVFGNAHDGSTVFENAPNNTTAKAIAINTASQWPFSGASHNLTRTHQGWGWIDLERMLRRAGEMIVVDETDVLAPLESTTWSVLVPLSSTDLQATLVYRDPPAVPSASIHRVNDLDLTVVSPDGTVYHGNWGLSSGTASVPGGEPDDRNTVENVFVPNPSPGVWRVIVTAAEVNLDAHVETPALDTDYALVVAGVKRPSPPPSAHAPGLR